MILSSSILKEVPGIIHGFGTFEEPLPLLDREKWDLSKPKWKQVHGVEVAEIKNSGQECGEVDALYSAVPQIPVAVVTADCVPILMANRFGKKVAAIHAGWRGTYTRILLHLWKKLESQGERPEEWMAAIGPAIGPCCYEVSPDLAKDFKRNFTKDFSEKAIVPRHRVLDLPRINALELEKIGLKKVDIIRACTNCSRDPKFHSHRRDHAGTRQFSMIQIL